MASARAPRGGPAPLRAHVPSPSRETPHPYQEELVQKASRVNALVSLGTGTGKTLIAAEVLRRRLAGLKAQGQVAIFLAPSNPLTEQQSDMLASKYGFDAQAFHGGNVKVAAWGTTEWRQAWQALDVLVMTPDVLLHVLTHGYMQVKQVGLLIFDEAHHTDKGHPYAQIMEDFWAAAPPSERPHVVALTASPEGMLPGYKRSKNKAAGKGLQANLRALVLTAPNRADVELYVHTPATRFLEYDTPEPTGLHEEACALLEAAVGLAAAAKKLELTEQMLRKCQQLQEAGLLDEGLPPLDDNDMAAFTGAVALDKQIRAVKVCFNDLGPWAGATAAYLGLLAPAGRQDAALFVPSGGMMGIEALKLMSEDDLGPEELPDLRSAQRCALDELLFSCLETAPVPGHVASYSLVAAADSSEPLLRLSMQQALVMTIRGLAIALLPAGRQRAGPSSQGLTEAFAAELAGSPNALSEGRLRQYAETMLSTVSWDVLQAAALRIPTASAAARTAAASLPAPLCTPKLACMLDSLQESCQRAERQRGASRVAEDAWACMVFVETRLGCQVVSRLINSLPALRGSLRARAFVGTEDMDTKAQGAAMAAFRSGEVNVLVCTNVGSEGMDFKQCSLVIAADAPQNVIHYIQCRGRARQAGSTYLLMHHGDNASRVMDLPQRAEQLMQEVHALSADNRASIRAGNLPRGGASPVEATAQLLPDATAQVAPPEQLTTREGARVTPRMAVVLLAEYCAKLPSAGSVLQAQYLTRSAGGVFVSTIFLPSNAGLGQRIVGGAASKRDTSRQLAALEALRQLLAAGQLDGHLQPTWSAAAPAQLEAQVVPAFEAMRRLPAPLAPAAAAGRGATLQLYTFAVAANCPQQNDQESTQQARQPGVMGKLLQRVTGRRAPSTTAAAAGAASAAAAAAAIVGAADWEYQAMASVPQALPPAQPHSSDDQRFGVLIAERLPDGLPLFAAHVPGQAGKALLQLQHAGSVELTAQQLRQLLAYQAVAEAHLRRIKLTSRLSSDERQPLPMAQVAQRMHVPQLQAAVQGAQPPRQAAAAAAPAAAPLPYMLSPLAFNAGGGGSCAVDWKAVNRHALGPLPAPAVAAAASAAPTAAHATLQAAAQQVAEATTQQQSQALLRGNAWGVTSASVAGSVAAVGARLQGRVAVDEYSRRVWRIVAQSSITPANPYPGLQQHGASNHAEYFARRYGITWLDPHLPMLQVRGGSGLPAANAFGPPRLKSGDAASDGGDAGPAATAAGGAAEGEGAAVRAPCYLPLDLLWVLPLPAAAWLELYILPSLMWRLQSLLQLQQLQQHPLLTMSRAQGAATAPAPHAGLLLAAMSPRMVRDALDNDKLEFLGDVLLKLLVSNALLQKYPDAVEGELSVRKAELVCNANLAAVADKPLAGGPPLSTFLRTWAFDQLQNGPLSMADQHEQAVKQVAGKKKADFVEALIGATYLSAAKAEEARGSSGGGSSGSGGSSSDTPLLSLAGLQAAAAFCERLGLIPTGTAGIACEAPRLHARGVRNAARARALAQSLRQLLGGYQFSQPALLQQALTHVSVLGVPSYQRLEFLGDALLDVMVSLQLLMGPAARSLNPGQLTKLRSSRVQNQRLAEAVLRTGLHKHLLMDSAPLVRAIQARAARMHGEQPAGAAAAAAAAGAGWQDAVWLEVWAGCGSSEPEAAAGAAAPAAAVVAAGSGAAAAASRDAMASPGHGPAGSEEAAGENGQEGEQEGAAPEEALPKVLADVAEALMAAVFIDSGGDYASTWQVMRDSGLVDGSL